MHCQNANTPTDWLAIAPSDTAPVDLVGLYVGNAGNLTMTTSKGSTTLATSIPE